MSLSSWVERVCWVRRKAPENWQRKPHVGRLSESLLFFCGHAPRLRPGRQAVTMKIYVSALRRPPSLLHPPHNGMDRISAKRLSSSSSVYAKFKCFSFSNPFIMTSLELQTGTILFLHKPTNTAATPQALRIRLCTILHLIGVNSLGLRVNPSSVRAVKQSDSSNSIADDEEFEFREAEEVGSAEDGDKFDDFEKVSEGNVDVMVEKIGSNKRRVTAHVCIEAPLDTVWQVLTDYEGLADFIPNLVACQLLERREHGARLLQIGEQKVALGLKFRAKGVLDVQENPVQISLNRICRDIMFEMVEGDFQVFRGVWHLEQVKSPLGGSCENLNVESNVQTTLSYILDVQPKIWLPVSLVETRLTSQVKVNLGSVRDRALQLTLSIID